MLLIFLITALCLLVSVPLPDIGKVRPVQHLTCYFIKQWLFLSQSSETLVYFNLRQEQALFMKLVKARTRGFGPVVETGWFDLSPGLNTFYFEDLSQGFRFLQALQTINPPYSCEELAPFSDFPTHINSRGYRRRIAPEKRTVALGVFAASVDLVRELAEISPLLFETDRIEVGRRLNYSRWSNFVELASSSRWSEVSSDLTKLTTEYGAKVPDLKNLVLELTKKLAPSDRIKDNLAKNLTDHLVAFQPALGSDSTIDINELLEKTRRHSSFLQARATVYSRLPLFNLLFFDGHSVRLHTNQDDKNTEHIYFEEPNGSTEANVPPRTNRNPGNRLQQLLAIVEDQTARAQKLNRHPPIFLIYNLEETLGDGECGDLVKALADIPNQCLYLTSSESFVKKLDSTTIFRDKDLIV